MMPPSAVADVFNAHAAAHNERVYGSSKRKLGENTQKGNREITDFFSSGPMGAESSKMGGGPRESKKRKLDSPPKKELELPESFGTSLIADNNTSSKIQSRIQSNSSDDEVYALPPRKHAKMKAASRTAHRVHKNHMAMMDEMSERDRKREIIMRRMQSEPTSQNHFLRGGDAQVHDDEGITEAAVSDTRDMFLHQINLEIKLQHETMNEIRCEIAKSQIALEQLRRCHLIPFPQSYADPESMLNIMDGTGPSIPQANGTKPKWASPFGVTEGAYTRHYAKWLIPDERVDGVAYEQMQAMAQESGYPFPVMNTGGEMVRMDGRQTRNSFQLDPVPKTKRRSRGDVSAPLQALSSGYAQKKEDAGPSVLKRGDGQWVKLVCIDCRRENFGSTQGFINHCRIAHKREFKSHEEAAVNSGQVVDVDHAGCVLGAEKIPTSVAHEGLVHHKIRSAPIDWTATKDVLQHVNDALREFREGRLAGVKNVPGMIVEEPQPSKDFSPAASTPHLSALLAKSGFTKSLDSAVIAAKTPVPDIEDDSDKEDEDMEDIAMSATIPVKESRKSGSKPTAKPIFRAPALPSVRPSSSSNNHAPILPPPRPNSSMRPDSRAGAHNPFVAHRSPQDSARAQAQAKAKEVQASINEAARIQRAIASGRLSPSAALPHQSLVGRDEVGEDDVMVVGVGVLRGGRALDEDEDMGCEDLSPTAHSEGDKAPSLVSDDDDYTAESHDESEDEGEGELREGEGIEVRDESDEARSRKRTASREEEAINVRGRVDGGTSKAPHAKKGVTFASPVKPTKKRRALGKIKK